MISDPLLAAASGEQLRVSGVREVFRRLTGSSPGDPTSQIEHISLSLSPVARPAAISSPGVGWNEVCSSVRLQLLS